MGIRQAQEDINSYYIVGYYSKNAATTENTGAST